MNREDWLLRLGEFVLDSTSDSSGLCHLSIQNILLPPIHYYYRRANPISPSDNPSFTSIVSSVLNAATKSPPIQIFFFFLMGRQSAPIAHIVVTYAISPYLTKPLWLATTPTMPIASNAKCARIASTNSYLLRRARGFIA